MPDRHLRLLPLVSRIFKELQNEAVVSLDFELFLKYSAMMFQMNDFQVHGLNNMCKVLEANVAERLKHFIRSRAEDFGVNGLLINFQGQTFQHNSRTKSQHRKSTRRTKTQAP